MSRIDQPLRDELLLWAVLLAVGIGMSGLLVGLGAPPPGSDDAWYKGPSAALALRGQLANPGLTGMFERAPEVSAVYPQLGQLMIAGFYAVFGVSRRVSLAWDLLVHVLGTLAIASAGLRLTRGFAIEPRIAWWAALVTGLVWLAGHRLLDRLEAIGLLFVWLDVVLGADQPFTVGRAARSGLFAGLAGLCAPWAGILGGALIGGRALAEHWNGSVRGALAAVPAVVAGAVPTVGLFALWAAGMEQLYPGIVDEQFFGALRVTRMYEGPPFKGPIETLSLAWRSLFVEATVVPGLLLSALWLPIAWRELPAAEGARAAALRRLALALNGVGIGALALGVVWRPTTYFYFWASAQLLMPAFAVVLARFLRDGSAFGRLIALGAVLVAWESVALTLWWTARSDPRERLDGAHAALHALIPPGVPVAATTSHWIAFEGRNPWVDATSLYKFDPGLIGQYDWLVLGRGVGQDRPEAILDQFELVDEVPTEVPVQVTYAWAVYRRIRPAEAR